MPSGRYRQYRIACRIAGLTDATEGLGACNSILGTDYRSAFFAFLLYTIKYYKIQRAGRKTLGLFAAIAVMASAGTVAAWPERPTTITVGSSPGGAADLSVRLFAPFLQNYLGDNANVIVVNMPGAGGEIAFTDLAIAPPDGTKINVASFPNLVSRLAEGGGSNYSLDSFTYLDHIVSSPAALAVPVNSPFQTLDELLEHAKANPGALSSAVGGIGNDDHLLFSRLISDTGIG